MSDRLAEIRARLSNRAYAVRWKREEAEGDIKFLLDLLASREADQAQLVKERDEAAWRPHEYHKRHLGGCRKEMYDPKSSPCTCQLEYERIATELGWSQGRVVVLDAELAALRSQLQGLITNWRASAEHDHEARNVQFANALDQCADQLDLLAAPSRPSGELQLDADFAALMASQNDTEDDPTESAPSGDPERRREDQTD